VSNTFCPILSTTLTPFPVRIQPRFCHECTTQTPQVSAFFFRCVTEQEQEHEELLKDRQGGITSLCACTVRYAIRVRGGRMISSSRIEINFVDLEIKSRCCPERTSGGFHESISRFLSKRKWWYSCFCVGLKSKGSRARHAGKNNTWTMRRIQCSTGSERI
jgi:hypothetical protein